MSFISIFFGVSLAYTLFCYPVKISILLGLECLFLFCIFSYYYVGCLGGLSSVLFPLYVLMVFLVLDSVVGVVLLLSVGRMEGSHCSWLD